MGTSSGSTAALYFEISMASVSMSLELLCGIMDVGLYDYTLAGSHLQGVPTGILPSSRFYQLSHYFVNFVSKIKIVYSMKYGRHFLDFGGD